MSTNYHQPKILSSKLQEALLDKCNLKYRVIILLMLDCGLRVTEVVSLQLKAFNFMEHYVLVTSLKKRGKDIVRKIPLSARLLEALSQYWQTIKDKSPDQYLFPGGKLSESGHLSRKQVWRKVKQLTNGTAFPHMLRHTFATRVVNSGNTLLVAKELLGHQSVATTELYTHVSDAQVSKAIQSIEQDGWLKRMKRRLFPPKPVYSIPLEKGLTDFHVGRKSEIAQLMDFGRKKINVFISGPQGIGKTHLLENYSPGGNQGSKIIRLGDMTGTKKLLSGVALHLLQGEKEAIAKTLFANQLEKRDLSKLIQRETIKDLTDLLIRIVEPLEYTLVIDDVSRIPPSGVNALEKLKNHYHIICAAREVRIKNISFLTNFERIELKPLSRPESIEMICRLTQGVIDRIEDFESFKNHIFENTNGVPLFIIEMIERYRKEGYISNTILKNYRHTAAYQELDFSLVIVVTLSSLMVLRYVSGEIGDDAGAFRLIGGVFLMFALFARNIFRIGKRRFV